MAQTTEKNVFQKLLEARKLIAETPIKKEGRNSYSKYDYFTPTQVAHLVAKSCQDVGLLTIYSLVNGEHGYKGTLTIVNTENPDDFTEFYMATATPDITATNIAQQMGGMATFNERYLKMSAFEIVDNNLDFDSQDNRDVKKRAVNKPKEVVQHPAAPSDGAVDLKPVTNDKVEAIIKGINNKKINYARDVIDNVLSKQGFAPLTDAQFKSIGEKLQ